MNVLVFNSTLVAHTGAMPFQISANKTFFISTTLLLIKKEKIIILTWNSRTSGF
jgi:hypothetical protein